MKTFLHFLFYLSSAFCIIYTLTSGIGNLINKPDPSIWQRGDKLVFVCDTDRETYKECEITYLDGQATNNGNMVFVLLESCPLRYDVDIINLQCLKRIK